MSRQPTVTQETSAHHSAPRGRREEAVLVGDVEELLPVLLEGGREVLRLLFDQVLVGVEVPGDEVEKLPRGGAGGQVVGLDGELDVQHLGVGAQHVPRHVHLHEHQLVVDDLREHGRGRWIVPPGSGNLRLEACGILTDWVASSSIPMFIRLASKNSLRLCREAGKESQHAR